MPTDLGELAADELFSILQVKEKLGRLRIHYRGPKRFFRLVDETCAADRKHCAMCGVPSAKPAVGTAIPVCPNTRCRTNRSCSTGAQAARLPAPRAPDGHTR